MTIAVALGVVLFPPLVSRAVGKWVYGAYACSMPVSDNVQVFDGCNGTWFLIGFIPYVTSIVIVVRRATSSAGLGASNLLLTLPSM